MADTIINSQERILRKPEVLDRTGLSDSTLYRFIQRGDFPAPVKIGARAAGWLESQVDRWIQARLTGTPWQQESAA